MRWLVLVVILGCAPALDGPVEKQRAADTRDAELLRSQLVALPGVERAEVIVRRTARDPLATTTPEPPAVSVVLIIDDKADRAKLERFAGVLCRAHVADMNPTIVVEVGAKRAELARVGPFTVEASSKGPLKAALAIALVVIAALAGWIAWSYRRGNSAQ